MSLQTRPEVGGGTPSGCSCRGGENRAGKDAQRIRVRWEWLSAVHEGQARLEVVSVPITTTSAHEYTHTEGGREGGIVTERGRVRRELVMRKGPLPL